jgi:hypothetical protein
MILKKLWRALRGFEHDEMMRQVTPYVPPRTELPRYQDTDKQQRNETQREIDEANSTLYRFTMNQTLRRRQY